jgi:CHAD domain-containing protein
LADKEDFAGLSKAFEALTEQLSTSRKPEARKELLHQLRVLLRKLDQANLRENSD